MEGIETLVRRAFIFMLGLGVIAIPVPGANSVGVHARWTKTFMSFKSIMK